MSFTAPPWPPIPSLEFKGALTGLLTTRGFRDVLELRRLRVPKLYDLFWDKPSRQPSYERTSTTVGVIASVGLAGQLGIDNVITFDMGGTTAKASVVERGFPDFTSEFEVAAGISLSSKLSSGGGYALSVPFIDLSEVGAGGGSIVWIDPGGRRRSARTAPVPAQVRCYARGGTLPTVTDANVVLGFINPASLLDGAMPIDAEAARAALSEQVAAAIGLSRSAQVHAVCLWRQRPRPRCRDRSRAGDRAHCRAARSGLLFSVRAADR